MELPDLPEPAVLGAWPLLRGLLILFVIVVHGLDALPLPELREQHLRTKVAQEELRRWTSLLQGVGLDVSQEEIAAFSLSVGGGAIRFRKAVMGPFRPVKRWTGTGQSWGLFAFPDPYPGRLVLSGRPADGEWVEVYRAPAEGDGWLLDQLLYRRVRGVWDDAGDRSKPGTVFNRFADWAAGRLFEDHPEWSEVSIRVDRLHVLLPDEGEWPKETVRHERFRRRAELESRPSAGGAP